MCGTGQVYGNLTVILVYGSCIRCKLKRLKFRKQHTDEGTLKSPSTEPVNIYGTPKRIHADGGVRQGRTDKVLYNPRLRLQLKHSSWLPRIFPLRLPYIATTDNEQNNSLITDRPSPPPRPSLPYPLGGVGSLAPISLRQFVGER